MQSFIVFILYMLYLLTGGQYLHNQLLKPKTDQILLVDFIPHILSVILYLLLQKQSFQPLFYYTSFDSFIHYPINEI